MKPFTVMTATIDTEQPAIEQFELLNAKLDSIMATLTLLDRRREELEELVTDMLPAVNGALAIAMQRLDEVEKNGTIAFLRESLGALEHVAQTVDPNDLHALAANAAQGVRTAQVLTAPELGVIAERTVAALARARTGKAPSLWQLLRARKEPRVRRGLAALLEIVRAVGEGNRGERTSAPPPRHMHGAHARHAPAAHHMPMAASTGPAQTRVIAGQQVQVDAEGFMTDVTQWTREVAEVIAAEAGIASLTPRHWEIIEFCRNQAAETGVAPGMRRITQLLGISARELYALFPKGPGILAARVAGLSKPRSCV